MQILHGFGTKYGMALYEIIAKRISLKHVFYNDLETDEPRDYFGVPHGKLGPFAALRRKAIEPAVAEVAEVNALAPFSRCIDTIETQGRKVTKLQLSWWLKTVDKKKAQWEAQQGKQADLFVDQLPEVTLRGL